MRRRVSRRNGSKVPAVRTVVEPRSSDETKARHLPMFGPDLAIMVPLHLLPAYLKLYSLRPMTRREALDLQDRGVRKPDSVLWVRREPTGEEK